MKPDDEVFEQAVSHELGMSSLRIVLEFL